MTQEYQYIRYLERLSPGVIHTVIELNLDGDQIIQVRCDSEEVTFVLEDTEFIAGGISLTGPTDWTTIAEATSGTIRKCRIFASNHGETHAHFSVRYSCADSYDGPSTTTTTTATTTTTGTTAGTTTTPILPYAVGVYGVWQRVYHRSFYNPFLDKVVLFGGASQTGEDTDIHLLDLRGTPTVSTLTGVTGTPPSSPRYSPAVVYDSINNVMYVHGGEGEWVSGPAYTAYQGGLYSFDFETNVWTQLENDSFWPETGHRGFFNTSTETVKILGGQGDIWIRTLDYNNVLTYMAGGSASVDLTGVGVRTNYVTAWDHDTNHSYIIGGAGSASTEVYKDFTGVADINDGIYAFPNPLGGAGYYNGKIIVFNYTSYPSSRNSFWVYDIANDTWSEEDLQHAENIATPISDWTSMCVTTSGHVVVQGGFRIGGYATNYVYVTDQFCA